MVTIFSGRNLLWHALAIVLTIIIVMSGGDWSYYVATRNETIQRLAHPAILLGTFLPLVLPLVLLIVGEAGKNRHSSVGSIGRTTFSMNAISLAERPYFA